MIRNYKKMINLRVRSEYSFRYAFGKLDDIIKVQGDVACLTDRGNSFGHIPFIQKCKELSKKPIVGVELLFCENPKLKVKYNLFPVTLLAKNHNGLKEIYKLISESTRNKYYDENRLGFEHLRNISDDVVIIIEDSFLQDYNDKAYYAVTPMTNYGDFKKSKLPFVAMSDNLYCKEDDKKYYEIILGKGVKTIGGKKSFSKCIDRVEPSHILLEEEWKNTILFLNEKQKDEAINRTYEISNIISDFQLPKAELPDAGIKKTLKELCEEGAKNKDIKLEGEYLERLNLELEVISQKKFDDYFFIVYDLINFAKEKMLVGPARGSSAGSLVCYLLSITEVDPLEHGLLFERFLDSNKQELPDIDIDFQDDKRDLVFEYAKNKYGAEKTAKLGVVSRYKPRAIIVELSKVLDLKPWDVALLREIFPEADPTGKYTFDYVFKNEKTAQEFLERNPAFENCKAIENHARHFGQHAAGLILSKDNLSNYTPIDYLTEGCQIDKHDAEVVNLLKVDILGLRTLTIIQNCLDEIGKDRQWLLDLPLDDKKAFDIINKKKYHGIFQFEGAALISVARNLHVEEFNDLVAITSLARPGTLINGEANRYVYNKNKGQIEYQHPILEKYLKETHGIIVYQEQIMKIVREVGNFSWADTSKIRKAIGKSKGAGYIDQMKPLFLKGCEENNVDQESAEAIWQSILAMGSYTFNKSHAVAYAMLSYWCMTLKAYYPMEFTLATLKDAKDDVQVIKMLRELVKDGFKYKVFDKDLSEVDWCIKDNTLIGGFTNIKGIAQKKAEIFIRKRQTGEKLTAVQKRLLYDAETPYDYLFEFKEKFGNFYNNWQKFCKEKPVLIQDIEEGDQNIRFLCKTIKVVKKDINSQYQLDKRDGLVIEDGCLNFVDLIVSDDTDEIKCRIAREEFETIGKKILKDKVGSFYVVRASCCSSFKFLFIHALRKITPEQINKKLGIDT